MSLHIKYIKILIMSLFYSCFIFTVEAGFENVNPFQDKQFTTNFFYSRGESGFHINNDYLFNKSNNYGTAVKSAIPVFKDSPDYTIFSEKSFRKKRKKNSSIYFIQSEVLLSGVQQNTSSYTAIPSLLFRQPRANEDPDDPNGNGGMPGQDLNYDPDDPNGNPMVGEAPVSGNLIFLCLLSFIYLLRIHWRRIS